MDIRFYFRTLGVIGLCLFGIPIHLNDTKLDEHKLLFESYVKKYNKHYVTEPEEYERRFLRFQVSSSEKIALF